MRRNVRRLLVPALSAVVSLALAGATARAQSRDLRGEIKGPTVGLLRSVAFEQNLNAQMPLDTPLRDESGHTVRFGDYFGTKPVVLLFGYYECPMLCSLELNGLVRNLRVLNLSVGKEFDVVMVSINPTESAALAKAKKAGYVKKYQREGAEAGWHFLTGDEPAIKRLTDVAGFRYAYDPKSKQYAHPAGLMVLTPQGQISRYIYGVDFPANNLRWSLVEASAGKIGTPVDKVLLMCFHYDPDTGRYNFAVMTAVRIGCVVTLVSLLSFMLVMFRRDRQRPVDAPNLPAGGPA